MSAPAIALVVAGLAVGATGTWSPCGFSMIDTLGRRGAPGSRAVTLAACAAFAPGSIAGGAATFGLLALAGDAVHGVGGRLAYGVAAAIALIAALAEARGIRIVPQIRRQLPESWRRRLPLPLAAGLYGVLLGLGFTTFVLSFGAWALAAISFAVGDPSIGFAVGVAFGIGRAVPIVLLAPIADRPLGVHCVELMAERPALYARARLGDAVALFAAAGAMVAVAGATAAGPHSFRGADPSAAGRDVAFQRGQSHQAFLRHQGQVSQLPGREPAIGGDYAVVKSPGRLSIIDRHSGQRLAQIGAKGVWASAISKDWLVYAQTSHGRDLIKVRPLTSAGQPRPGHLVARVKHPVRLGHPGIDGDVIAFSIAGPEGNRIAWRRPSGRGGGVIARSQRAALCCASVWHRHVLYVRAFRTRESPQATAVPPLEQDLVVARVGAGGNGHRLYSRRGSGGTIYSTALSAQRAYFTLLRGRHARIQVVHR